MSSSNRQASLSPNERQRTKSRSSSRSSRTSRTVVMHETNPRSIKTSIPNIRESKRAGSSSSNASPNASKRQKSKGKTSPSSKSKSPSPNRKGHSKKKKTPVIPSDGEDKHVSPPNDTRRQDLTSRGLSVIPNEVFDLVTLRHLVLANNNLPGLPPDIRVLVNLEYLDISRNPLRVKNGLDDYSCLPREFRFLRKLQTLIMAECTLKHIPPAIWNVVSLQTLDIGRNKVGYLVGEIGNLIDIRHLRLSQMDLDTLPPEIGFCDKLETIDLTGNPIDNLPETLVECRQVSDFKIGYKTFYKLLDSYMLQLIDEGKIRSEHIPHVIFELENLQILDLNQTKLNFIPMDHTLLHLKELYLSNNSFLTIPESICSMGQLKILDMSHNRLETIPEYFLQIKRLKTLILSYNHLKILPNIIVRLPTITKLIVSHNQIQTIENGMSQNRSLLTLDLSYNNLKILSNDLCHLEQLETLDLRYNQLEYLPLSIRQMKGLKSMNIFDDDFQRIGLHLLGNTINDPPSYIWKSTKIETLFDYIERKEKNLSNEFFHLKLILLGPKNTGKTTLTNKLLRNHKLVTDTRKTLDMYVAILQENQLKFDEENAREGYHRQRSSDNTSSVLTDQWIENRVSTSGEYSLNRSAKIKRNYPPPLKTYRENEIFEYFINKSTIITRNNLFCTIFDTTSEPSFEILYPLIYDSNALFILPINLTVLFDIIQAATSLDKNNDSMIDYERLLTDDWLYHSIFRYIESIADHCQQASIAIVGFVWHSKRDSIDQLQQLLDEIHSKINMFLTDEEYQRKNVVLYSEFFPEPIYLQEENMSDKVIEIFESIAQQWNITHHKQKREVLKRRLGFMEQDLLIIDYDTCSQRFEQSNSSVNDQMTLDDCLNYLILTGDILCVNQGSQLTILLKPYYLLNNILSRTIFRPHIDQWLNYDENMIFHFSGYYRTEELFNIDRDRLLTRGEFTWKMLNILFLEQNHTDQSLIEQDLIDSCRLMERLYLGFVNESNLNYREFTTIYFVCPWLCHQISIEKNSFDYFKSLEQTRAYENLQRQRTRKIKQQQLWLDMDNEQDILANHLLENSSIEELPSMEEIEIDHGKIMNEDSIEIMKIRNENSNLLPNGLYERLLICLHPLFDERLDYSNMTFGRTREKNLIQIERCEAENSIWITTNHCLFESIQTLLHAHLFSFYPMVNLRIET